MFSIAFDVEAMTRWQDDGVNSFALPAQTPTGRLRGQKSDLSCPREGGDWAEGHRAKEFTPSSCHLVIASMSSKAGAHPRKAKSDMSSTAPILYSGFYDFPLAFTVRAQGRPYLFLRDFDEEQDEYESEYRVYSMPLLTDDEIRSSWLTIESKVLSLLGAVAVADISFDATHRKEIQTDILDTILASPAPRPAGPVELVGASV